MAAMQWRPWSPSMPIVCAPSAQIALLTIGIYTDHAKAPRHRSNGSGRGRPEIRGGLHWRPWRVRVHRALPSAAVEGPGPSQPGCPVSDLIASTQAELRRLYQRLALLLAD